MADYTGDDTANRFDGEFERRNTAHMAGGDDIAIGGDLLDRLYGEAGDDELRGGDGADLLDGGDGNDSLYGETGDDTIDGGLGVDQLFGGAGDDEIVFAGGALVDGRAGDDLLNGARMDLALFARIDGGAGDDEIRLSAAIHGTFIGGAGEDTISYLFLNSTIGVTVDLLKGYGAGDAAGDGYVRIEDAIGTDADDTLIGNGAINALFGSIGDDVLAGGGAGDFLDGSTGDDVASFVSSSAAVAVDLAAHTASGGEAQEDVLISIEDLWGSSFGDKLTGDYAANTLRGFDGNDRLSGGGGADTLAGQSGDDELTGGEGADTLSGGSGADAFILSSAADSQRGAGRDRITDFSHAEHDVIRLQGIDADATAAADQAFTFIGQSAFHGVAGELRAVADGSQIAVYGDTNGDKVPDFQLTVVTADGLPLGAADFVL